MSNNIWEKQKKNNCFYIYTSGAFTIKSTRYHGIIRYVGVLNNKRQKKPTNLFKNLREFTNPVKTSELKRRGCE